jgi:2'-5' RNA ligase
MHLTLCFLGETDSAAVPHLAALLHDLCAAESPFDLRLGPVGAFPHLVAPRVVWVGLEGEIDALIRLAGLISSAVAPFRAAPEARPFHPHITIGRTRGRATYAERQRVGRVLHGMPAAPPVAWTVDRVVLFESRMAAGERSYLALATAGLGEGTAG